MVWTGQWSYKVDGTEINDRVNQFCQIPELSNRPERTLRWAQVDGDYPVVVAQQPEAGRITFLIAMRAISDSDFDTRIRALDRLFGDGSHTLIVQARGMAVERALVFWVESTMVDYKQRLFAATASVPRGRWTGERLASFDSITGWVAGANSALSLNTSDKQVGTGAMDIAVTGLTGGAWGTSYVAHDTDLTPYLNRGRGIRVWVKATSITNLSALYATIYGPDTSTYGCFNIKPALANTWYEKEVALNSPTLTSGTPDWLRVVRVGISVVAGGGSYTGTIRTDNLRIGSI